MRAVFVDTSAIYAYLDRGDRMHEPAKETWRRLIETDTWLMTTNYVLVETSALLRTRIGMVAVKVFAVDIAPLLNVQWIDHLTHASASSAHFSAGRRNLSLVDCVSFEVMRRSGVTSAFTFDAHFKEFGFEMLPT